MLKVGDKAPRVHRACRRRRQDKTQGPARQKGRPLLLSQGQHAGLHHRDNIALFAKQGAPVLGVSPDSVASHDRFKSKFDLPFPLISDPEHGIAESYGVWQEKSLYGRKFMGIVRSTFVIDDKGKTTEIHSKVGVKDHVRSLLKTL